MSDPWRIRAYDETERITHYFAQGVGEIMRPFKPGTIRVSVNHELGAERTIFVQIGTLKSKPCITSINLRADPYEIVDHLIEAVRSHYDELYIEPEDHIQLSEN